MLRDRGYAETSPVAGRFAMDERDGLLLTTSYETMDSLERFSFAGPNVRLRTSTVEGLSNTASFCVETRISAATADRAASDSGAEREEQLQATAASPGRTPSISLLGW